MRTWLAPALVAFVAIASLGSAALAQTNAPPDDAKAAARVARVRVVTDLPASVQLDGVEAGRTPLAEPLRVASGGHTIAALAPGYQPTRRELTLAGQVTEPVTLALLATEPGAAHLDVSTSLPA